MPDKFHHQSKESGNKLKANILNFSSVATGVFFFTLTGNDVSEFAFIEKVLLFCAMSFFAVTVALCLLELHVDSKRFFSIAKQLERHEKDRNWQKSKKLKRLRIRLIYASYMTMIIGFVITFLYMMCRIA